jgi:hypothetical protein
MKNLKLNFNQNILIQNIGTIRFILHRFRMHSFQAPIYLSSIDQRISDLLNKFSGSSYIVHWQSGVDWMAGSVWWRWQRAAVHKVAI